MADSPKWKRRIREGWLAPGDPLDYSGPLVWGSLIDLGLARWPPLIKFVPPDYVERLRARASVDVCGFADGLVKVRLNRMTHAPRPDFYPLALSAFRAGTDDPPLLPQVAEWLWLERAAWEQRDVLSEHAWCVHCGEHFIDARVRRGHVKRIAAWCRDCRRLNTATRHTPALRLCAAPNCFTYFRPTRPNQIFHKPRCKEAARTWTGAPRPPVRRAA